MCTNICGDAAIVDGELCDDGNVAAGDGCDELCQVEQNYTCTGTPSVCTLLFCGDGLITGDEQCDDLNSAPGDGCDATCVVEAGFTCNGIPSVCTPDPTPPPVVPGPAPGPAPTPSMAMGNAAINSIASNSQKAFIPPVTAPAPAPASNAGLTLDSVNSNMDNVFVKLITDPEFTFDSSSEMRRFIKSEFPTPGTEPAMARCQQNNSNKKEFSCLLAYGGGGIPPNPTFPVNFSFSKDGYSGQLTVTIDTTKTSFALRSLRL